MPQRHILVYESRGEVSSWHIPPSAFGDLKDILTSSFNRLPRKIWRLIPILIQENSNYASKSHHSEHSRDNLDYIRKQYIIGTCSDMVSMPMHVYPFTRRSISNK